MTHRENLAVASAPRVTPSTVSALLMNGIRIPLPDDKHVSRPFYLRALVASPTSPRPGSEVQETAQLAATLAPAAELYF